jgi:ABC-2 type transport system permease protein
LVRNMMSGYVESSSAALSIVILVGFAITMTLLASYVFTREVNKPF